MNTNLRFALTAFLLFLLAPGMIYLISPVLGLRVDSHFGDYVGGVSSWLTQAVTVALLIMIWRTERNDDRKAAFSDGLLRLIELYVKERDRLDTARLSCETHFFAWIVAIHAPRMAACVTPAQKHELAISILEEQYRWLARWRLSLFRLAMYVSDAKVSEEAKQHAMKLIRASCERDEQRAFFLLLHERHETSHTAKQFIESDFFAYAQIAQDVHLQAIKNGTYESWKKRL